MILIKPELVNTVVIIPAFNEASSIGDFINQLSTYGPIIVVDDGSTDGTLELCESRGVTVISHESNLGYGRAIKTGLGAASELNYQYAITIDADGQHNVTDVVKIYDLLEDGFDLVCGNRQSFPRLAEQIFALYFRWKCGIADPLCGFKGYRLASCRRFIRSEFTCVAGAGIAIFAARSQLKVANFFTKVAPRKGRSRYGTLLSANIKIMYAFFLIVVSK